MLAARLSQWNGRLRLTCNSSSSPVTHLHSLRGDETKHINTKTNFNKFVKGYSDIKSLRQKKCKPSAVPLEPGTRKRSLPRPPLATMLTTVDGQSKQLATDISRCVRHGVVPFCDKATGYVAAHSYITLAPIPAGCVATGCSQVGAHLQVGFGVRLLGDLIFSGNQDVFVNFLPQTLPRVDRQEERN